MLKKIISIVLILINIESCFAQTAKQVDKKIVDCLLENFNKYGFDIKGDLIAFESRLVEEKYLLDTSGESYLEFYEDIVKQKDIPIVRDYGYTSLDSVPKPEFSNCYNKELLLQSKSPLSGLSAALEELSTQEVNPSSVASTILKTLHASDYTWESVRYYSLYSFYTTSTRNNGLTGSLPESTDEINFTDYAQEYLAIELWKSDSLLLNKILTPKERIQKALRAFITQKKEKTVFYIHYATHKDLLYTDFLEIMNLLTTEISAVTNSLAVEMFGIDYTLLTKEQRRIISAKQPVKINFELLK